MGTVGMIWTGGLGPLFGLISPLYFTNGSKFWIWYLFIQKVRMSAYYLLGIGLDTWTTV